MSQAENRTQRIGIPVTFIEIKEPTDAQIKDALEAKARPSPSNPPEAERQEVARLAGDGSGTGANRE